MIICASPLIRPFPVSLINVVIPTSCVDIVTSMFHLFSRKAQTSKNARLLTKKISELLLLSTDLSIGCSCSQFSAICKCRNHHACWCYCFVLPTIELVNRDLYADVRDVIGLLLLGPKVIIREVFPSNTSRSNETFNCHVAAFQDMVHPFVWKKKSPFGSKTFLFGF